MFKFVIYKAQSLQIVKLTDEEPSFTSIKDDEDFDLVSNWKLIPNYSKSIDDYLTANVK